MYEGSPNRQQHAGLLAKGKTSNVPSQMTKSPTQKEGRSPGEGPFFGRSTAMFEVQEKETLHVHSHPINCF